MAAGALAEVLGGTPEQVENAAEIGMFSPLAHIPAAIWTEVLELNLTANWRLLRAIDPLLRAAPAGRGIFVTGGLGRDRYAYGGPYLVSKTALDALVKIYAAETANTRVRVNLIDPGAIRTRLRAHAFPGEDPSSLPPPESVTELFVDLASPTCVRNGEVLNLTK